MRVIKAFTVLAVLATLAWGGYWFVGSRALDRALSEGLARQSQLSVAGHRIMGFPNRFDITLDQPRLSFAGGVWAADFVHIFALTYRLNHLIAVFAPEQRLTMAGHAVTLESADLRASVQMEAGLDLPLDQVALVGEGLTLTDQGASHRLGVLRLASRRIAADVQELALLAEDVQPDPATLDRLDPARTLPRHLRVLRLDAEVQTDRPLDRHALSGPPPAVTRLTLTGARLAWVDSDVSLAGRLTPDAQGNLSGDVVLRIDGWPALLARARATGMLEPGQTGPLGALLAALPTEAGGETVEVPLAVTAGDVRLGPILLLTLPPLR
jgi:hypothetical protein